MARKTRRIKKKPNRRNILTIESTKDRQDYK